ncbi:ribosomal protection-like ABC-F family protein [Geotoga petraea]|uniref:ATP-binding cassette, subfamily F, member 3 n=1 Tax=Geotoga petraea TaxID=28234 RepID=A0A1G6HZJ5_9BACT|nr:ATP-binding cassette domain-containing protein [Geotoga petraea]MDK2945360.1 ATP-binding cassette, subfamily er 3 [Geotoga sp.]SDB99245.1 ATP-binding cassette, subfamily F, member 3 [Geotoga petraea]
MLLRLEDVSHNFADQDLFYNVNLSVYPGDRIALIGKNGSGKTTLLNIISDKLEPTEGKLHKNNQLKINFLTQFRMDDPHINLYDFVREEIKEDIDEFMLEKRVRSTLVGVGFKDDEWNRKVSTLSGGELTRLSLGKTLVGTHNLLLLDEPTNHLDLYSINWLKNYLKNYKGAIILVSHDREFLKSLCNRFWEINSFKVWDFKGNYEKYLSNRENLINSTQAQKENLEKEIKRLEDMVQRYRKWGTEKMVKQAIIRERTLSKLKEDYESIKNIEKENSIKLKIPEPRETGYEVINVKNISFSYYESQPLLKDISFNLKEGEKLSILGKNGSGKSTLLKILTGKIKNYKGKFEWGYNIDIGYIDQVISSFNQENDILTEMWSLVPDWKDFEVRRYIGKFGFVQNDVFKEINTISGGELTRLAIAKVLLKKPNVLILDEPTNHLDILTVEVLEDTLKEFKGSIIMVSHDEELIRNISDKYMLIENGKNLITDDLNNILTNIKNDSFKIKKKNKPNKDYEKEKKLRNRIKSLNSELDKLRNESETLFLKLDNLEKEMIERGDNYTKVKELMDEKIKIEKKINYYEIREEQIIKELAEIENSEG